MPHSTHTLRLAPPRASLLAAAALASGALATGCGESSGGPSGAASTSASTASAIESGVAFSRCIRSHGVTNFPDPKQVGADTIQMSPHAAGSPAFQSAAHSCQRLLPKGAPGPGPPAADAQARLLKVSDCMRKHGISDFPDPTTSPPANSAGNSGIIGNGGYYLAIPSSIGTNAPAFERAAAACNFGPRG